LSEEELTLTNYQREERFAVNLQLKGK